MLTDMQLKLNDANSNMHLRVKLNDTVLPPVSFNSGNCIICNL